MKLSKTSKSILRYLAEHGATRPASLPNNLHDAEALLDLAQRLMFDYVTMGTGPMAIGVAQFDHEIRFMPLVFWQDALRAKALEGVIRITDEGKRAIVELTPFEKRVIETLEKAGEPVTGERLLPTMNVAVSGHNRGRLSSMKKRGLIKNEGNGYFL